VQTPHDTFPAILKVVPRFVLMHKTLDIPNHRQPALPWAQVQARVPLIRGFASTPNAIARTFARPLMAVHCPPSATIRVVEGTIDPKPPNLSSSSQASSTTTLTKDTTPTPTLARRTVKSLSFRSKDKMSAHTTPTHLRGKTVPTDCKPQTPERERDRDADSVISFTPSMSNKHLANWFSGLLGGSG
jgi:hypothetical protein